MKRVAGLAKRLAATASNARSHLRMMNFSVAPAGESAGLAAVAVASAAAVATAQWARAEAAQQQPHTQQNEAGSQDESCKECTPDVQLEEQPVAISNSATAQWRVFTDMGRELVQQGRHREAERYFKKAVEMARQGFGEDDPHMASACNNLAEFYRLRRQFDLAEPLYKQALEVLTRAYGLHDARVAFALHNLGGFYLSRRQLAQAADCYEQALKMKLEVLGTGHSETSNTMYHLAEVRWQQGHRDNAVQLLKNSLEIMESQGVGATPGCVRRRGRLAEMHLEQGNAAEAERLLRAILAYVESTQGLEHANYATAAENLASALQQRGAWDEARRLMHGSLEMRSTHVGARHPVVAVTLRKLAELELAAAAAEDAAAVGHAAAQGSRDAGEAVAQPQPAQPGLAERGRQQAVAIAQEALSIAQQAQAEALEWEARRGQPEAGGLLAWLRPKPALSPLRRPQRPDSAALEVAQSLQVLARAHAATGAAPAAAQDLERGLAVLADAFPHAGRPAGGDAEQAAQAAQRSSGGNGDGGNARTGREEADEAEAEAEAESEAEAETEAAAEAGPEAEARCASTLALALSAKEAARAARVEKARHELACGLLAELLALAQAATGSVPDAASVGRRWAAEGCGKAAQP